MLEPLQNIQVWRFSLYYFFVFGAFVALALWLPRYLIGVYGLDIATAGMIGAVLLGARRACSASTAAISPTPTARAASCTGRSASRSSCCFLLTYPPTEYIVQGIRGPMRVHARDRR